MQSANLEFELRSVLLQRCQAIHSQSKTVNLLQMCSASIRWWKQTNKTSIVHTRSRGSYKPDTTAVVLVTSNLSCPFLDSGEGFYSWIFLVTSSDSKYLLLLLLLLPATRFWAKLEKHSERKQLTPSYEKSSVLVASNLIIHIINPQLAHYPDRQ